uniref:Uncharacterized protein n=1 Tax=Panagrolaimus sp. ES5 TaxID=591445 RepID=A0AC34F1V5_9BILA
MAQFGTLIIATFSVLTLLSIYVTAGPIGDRSTTPSTTNPVVEDTTILATTKEVALANETGIVDTLTTEIDIVGGNETHIRQKRSCHVAAVVDLAAVVVDVAVADHAVVDAVDVDVADAEVDVNVVPFKNSPINL